MTIINTSNSSSIIILILIGICLSLIALITALGNIIVLLAFYCDKNLRTINDYFILNMAIADFLVGSFCIPFYIPFSITQLWPFGSLFCKIWVTIDDVATMTSVLNIVAISINRYWSIAYPISYRKYVKQHFVYLVMGAIWCFSFINFAPGIWLLSLFNNNNNITRSDCSGDYNRSFVYMLIAQFNYFIWPFIVLCVLNMLIMLNLWKRSRKMNRLMSFNQYAKHRERNIGSSSLVTSKDIEDDQHLPSLISSYSIIIQKQSSTITNSSVNRCYYRNKKDSKETCKSLSMSYLSRKCANVNFSPSYDYRSDSLIDYRIESETKISRSIINELRSQNHLNNKKYKRYRQCDSRIIRDRKAARSLFILVIVFLIFLFPYVICAIAITADVNISGIIFEISFWLLWLNSTCNPFLYPFIQIKYRRAYLKLYQSCLKYFTFSRSNHSF
ncbi:unnamed protein product [Rotaria sordida]|uniref:G-protein coupled receptors family 1 profile domain-containing protein n=1 Tax=Rotaria sordida TaxID=392033 RepID=A0A815YC39_9BILA|nr:unnamed protein product [Rotaria sordida]CAF1567907.1 unnamed protein product [Rotaria sordida]